MIDFNEAEIQGEVSAGCVPPGSIVPLTITVTPPKAGKESSVHALFSKSPKGNDYLNIEFTVGGKYAGARFWQSFTLVGSEQAARISMRTIRAMVESAKGIDPQDASPQAAAGRKISDWADLTGMTFLAQLDCEATESKGKWYMNNTLKQPITPDKDAYKAGEHISDNPIPPLPAGGSAPAAAGIGSPTWSPAPTEAAPIAVPTVGAPAGLPSWARK